MALEIKLKDQTKELEMFGQSADSISSMKNELEEYKTKLKGSEQRVLELEERLKEEKLRAKEQLDEGAKTEKVIKDQFDTIEKDNEKLTKEMLKHLRRADQLSQTVNTVIIAIHFPLYFNSAKILFLV